MLVLRELPGVGPVRIREAIERYESAVAALEAVSLGRAEDVIAAVSRTAVERATVRADGILAACRRHGIRPLAATDPEFPEPLRKISDPPALLFMRGTWPEEMSAPWTSLHTVAVVGTRDPSARARRFAEDVGRELAATGVVVVSGLARGIDGAAHEGALAARNSPVVAVLAGGLEVVRPAVHTRLAERILAAGGALISEDPPESVAYGHRFVARNRIVSGLSRGVVVVEAGSRSGALHTADFALEEGRTVFTVPDHPAASRARGNFALLRDGAVPIASAEDVLRHFGWTSDHVRLDATLADADLDLLRAVADRAPCTIDALRGDALRTAVDLTRLEIDGWVERDSGSRYLPSASGRRLLMRLHDDARRNLNNA